MADGAANRLDLRVTPLREDLAAAHLEGVLAAPRYVEPRWMVCATATAPLTSRPNADASMTTELLHGERFAVYDSRPGWLWGQSERDGYVGWAPDSCLMAAGAPATARVRALHALVYPSPDLKTRPIAALPFGARLRAGENDGRGWRPVEPGGWVPAPHLASPDAPEPGGWVDVAERFLGTPYLWGGRSAAGIDCSGLVQVARQAAGFDCPRDSDMQQAAPGHDVDGDLRRGDLVFWKGHVGVMLSPTILLHANAFHMACACEPLAEAEARIASTGGGPIAARRRWDP